MLDDVYTKALLHMNGTDASTTFTDESGKAWTAAGNAQIDTAQSKFGGASGLFDGTGDWISTPDHDDFNYGSGDFTIDFWVRFNSLASISGIYGQFNDTNNQVRLFWSTTNNLQFDAFVGGSVVFQMIRSWTPSTGTWYHVAVVRKGNNWYMFVDGSQIGTTYVDSDAFPDIAGTVFLGAADTFVLNGWLDEVRVSKGVARWIANFTPPTREYIATGGFFSFFYP